MSYLALIIFFWYYNYNSLYSLFSAELRKETKGNKNLIFC